MIRLAIVSTHPIQYNAPWFKMLAEQQELSVKVFYTWSQSQSLRNNDEGFGREITWDIPLLEGYAYTFVNNISSSPGIGHFNGIDNPTLIEEIENWQTNVVLVYGWNFKSHLNVLRHFHGRLPVLFRGDSTLLDEQPGLKKIFRRIFLRWVYKHIDYALYVGKNNKAYYLAHGVSDNKLFYLPHAVDNNRFSQQNDDIKQLASQFRTEHNISPDAFVILFAGKFEPKKDPLFMLSLAKLMTDEKLRFVLVGNGMLEEQLKHEAAQDARIIFMGFKNQREMPAVYQMADIFILPSKGPGETWGLAMNEAMACRLPVIATTKVGGAIDLIENNVNGTIIEPGDAISCQRYLQQLINNRSMLAQHKDASAKRITAFSYRENSKKLLQLLDECA